MKTIIYIKTRTHCSLVILDAPTGMSSDVWALVQPELAKTTRVCVYDRAGLGFSERPPYKVHVQQKFKSFRKNNNTIFRE